jgi:hypothetical protein
VHPIGQVTHTRRTDGAPESDGALKVVPRSKIIHYRQLYPQKLKLRNLPVSRALGCVIPAVIHT